MLTRDQALQRLHDKREFLREEFGVSRIGIFGSTAADRASEASDVDIVVEFDRPVGFRFMELAEYLEGLMGRRVDLLTHTGVRAIRVGQVADNISDSVIYA